MAERLSDTELAELVANPWGTHTPVQCGLRELQEARAELWRVRPVVEAAQKWREFNREATAANFSFDEVGERVRELKRSVDAYEAEEAGVNG